MRTIDTPKKQVCDDFKWDGISTEDESAFATQFLSLTTKQRVVFLLDKTKLRPILRWSF